MFTIWALGFALSCTPYYYPTKRPVEEKLKKIK